MLLGRSLVPIAAAWMALVGAGLYAMGRYENTPGPMADAPAAWPAGTALSLSPDHRTVLVFMHPRCSCSAATLSELESVLQRTGDRIDATAVFLRPSGVASDWMTGPIVEQARAIPGLSVVADPDGAEAHRFRALTSGFAVLYTSSGTLGFAGGLTGARGQTGDSPAMEDLVRAARGGRPYKKGRVFGCLLGNSGERAIVR